jgi:hypothetical protein
MKTYGGVDVWIHVFLTSALVRDEWSGSCSCRFTPGERTPGTHWTGGWVDPRAGLDDMEKRTFLALPGLELRPLGLYERRFWRIERAEIQWPETVVCYVYSVHFLLGDNIKNKAFILSLPNTRIKVVLEVSRMYLDENEYMNVTTNG